MGLHGNVRVQMIESAVRFLAAIPSAFVHALDFFVSSSGSFVLLCAWNRHKRVHSGQRMPALGKYVSTRVYSHTTRRVWSRRRLGKRVAVGRIVLTRGKVLTPGGR